MRPGKSFHNEGVMKVKDSLTISVSWKVFLLLLTCTLYSVVQIYLHAELNCPALSSICLFIQMQLIGIRTGESTHVTVFSQITLTFPFISVYYLYFPTFTYYTSIYVPSGYVIYPLFYPVWFEDTYYAPNLHPTVTLGLRSFNHVVAQHQPTVHPAATDL